MNVEVIVAVLFMLVAIYLLIGILFAIPFVIKWVDHFDEGAHGSSWGFRVIIIPGVMVFWPVLWKKWSRMKKISSAISRSNKL